MPPGAMRSASGGRQIGDRLLRLSAMAAKCCSSSAINTGSALATRRSGRSNALVVRNSRHRLDPPRDPHADSNTRIRDPVL
jgi:hypothetical protein